VKQFQGVSKRAKELLESGETHDIEYKLNLRGLHPEDLVAFANSVRGGAILIGVQEFTGDDGVQHGRAVGCAIDDEARLQVLGKSLSCSPAVEIDLIAENVSRTPFFRIEIPSGSHKPYATSSGTYKIREDARNAPLLPEQLLKLFLDREGSEFRVRFSEATGALESRMNEALSAVKTLEIAVSERIEEIGRTLGWAEYKAGDAADTIETVQAQVAKLSREQDNQTRRIRALVRTTGADDPIRREAENEILEYVLKKLADDPELLRAAQAGQSLSVSLSGAAAAEVDQDDLKRIFLEAVRRLATVEGNS
jgi:hypothetical protein